MKSLGISPFKTENTGYIFIDQNTLNKCYDDFEIAHYRNDEGYKTVWYDALDVADNTEKLF